MNPQRTAICLFHVALSLPRSASKILLRVVADLQTTIVQNLSEDEKKYMEEQKDAMLSYVSSLKPSARKRLAISKAKPITSGFNGLLFPSTNPSLVIKASIDEDEYRNAIKLINKDYVHIAAVVHAEKREMRDGQPIYFLMMERLYSLPQTQLSTLERVLDPLWGTLDRRNIEALEEALEKERDRCQGFVKSTLTEVLSICGELKRARLWHTDLHSRNIMADEDGVLKVVDLAAIHSY